MYISNFRDNNNNEVTIEGKSLEELRAELERWEYTGSAVEAGKVNGDESELAGWVSATTWRYC